MSVAPRKRYTLRLNSGQLVLGERTLIMGVINVTPDSFSDGGEFFDFDLAFAQARRLIDEGVDILDIGGESTRPGSDPVSAAEEMKRVIPLITEVRRLTDLPISIDTTKAEVARRAIEAGASILNDVSSLRFDPQMVEVAASSGLPLVLMHMLGKPKTMQQDPWYASLFSEIISFLEERIQFAVAGGVDRGQIVVDPGIGFGKTVTHNLLLVRDLDRLQCLDRPIMLGASRKRFIGSVLDLPPQERQVGSAIVHSLGIAAGAHIIRVHDAAIHKQVVALGDALREGFWPSP